MPPFRASVALLAAAALGCGAAAAAPPGAIRVSMLSDPHSFNPIVDNDLSTSMILDRVFEYLVDPIPPDYAIAPSLPET